MGPVPDFTISISSILHLQLTYWIITQNYLDLILALFCLLFHL